MTTDSLQHFRWTRIVLALALAAAVASCARPLGSRDTTAASATVRVENLGFLDVNVYAIRSGQRHRLGTVTGSSARTFPVPRTLVGTGVPVRFQADFIGSSRAPVSEQMVIWDGDEVGLRIPPS